MGIMNRCRASFSIGRTNGVITIKEGTELDYEASTPNKSVTVRATDPSGLSATVKVTIQVNPVEEAPTLNAMNVTFPEDGTGTVNLHGHRPGGRWEETTRALELDSHWNG